MISRLNSNMGHLELKTRSHSPSKENLDFTIEIIFSAKISRKFDRKFVKMISRSSLNMGHLVSKSRSRRQSKNGKPSYHPWGKVTFLA
jgi:hypothetical protein